MSFAPEIKALMAKAKIDLDLVVRKVTFELFNKIVLRSPVGNPSLWAGPAPKGYVGGRFRANWNVSRGTPNYTISNSTNSNRGSKEAAKALTYKTGGVVYLTNGLPYAKKLEDGYSTQAPIGFVKISIVEFERQLKNALRSK